MGNETTLLSILPNLSIGVISVLSLVYTVLAFLKALDSRAEKHEAAMSEREAALRGVEADVRKNLVERLAQSTSAIEENSRVMGRVMRHLDGSKH